MGQSMTIRKVTGLEGGFSIVPNATINDNLSWEALGLLAYLCSKPDDWDVCISQLINHSAKSKRPSKRDKTYLILKELEEAGYMRKVKGRKRGQFTGVDYIVSPTKLDNFPKNTLEPPLTDLPYTDLPDTANPTQQRTDSNKEQKEHIGEKVSPTNFALKMEDPKPKRKRHTYTQEFEDFFKAYPKTNGSKLEAFKVWKGLDNDEKQAVNSAVLSYNDHLKEQTWQKAMNPARFIRGEHYLSYYTPNGVLKGAERVFCNGKWFASETLVELCVSFYRSSEWKFERLLGPAPNQKDTKIPLNIVEKAKEVANECEKA